MVLSEPFAVCVHYNSYTNCEVREKPLILLKKKQNEKREKNGRNLNNK